MHRSDGARFVLCDDFWGLLFLYFPDTGDLLSSRSENETSGRMVCSGLLDLCRSDGGIDFCSRLDSNGRMRNEILVPHPTVHGVRDFVLLSSSRRACLLRRRFTVR